MYCIAVCFALMTNFASKLNKLQKQKLAAAVIKTGCM